MGTVGHLPGLGSSCFEVMWICEQTDQEVSLRSRAIPRHFSSVIFQGKNRSISSGTWPPFWAQLSRNQVSHLRQLIFTIFRVASREKSIAAKRPLHNAPRPE